MAEWQLARLIPVSGIGSEREAEVRSTSALLAVISAVRDLSKELFGPLGASKAQRAEVRCYTEVPFKLGAGKTATRPDGLIEIVYGKSTWTALVEVKTGRATLDADQLNAYWDLARQEGYDAVVTISNELARAEGVHPTEGLKVRANSKVKFHHFSWTMLLATCEVIRDHRGVEDIEQAWILGELIRYLRHEKSGATAFDDMGSEWVAVRDGARDASLRRGDPAVREIAYRWDQLLRYAALRLEAEIGEAVTQQVPAGQRDPSKRLQYLVDLLANDGHLSGTLRIPNTIGDLELLVDLRARRISAAVSVAAPEDRGGRARCTWLAGQLSQAVDSSLMIEAYAKNARTPVCATLAAVREDKDVLLGDDKKDPTRFRLILTKEMGVARKAGRAAPGFIESVIGLITDFYGTVVQDLAPWTPKAPKINRPASRPEPHELDEPQRDPTTVASDSEDHAPPLPPPSNELLDHQPPSRFP
ncbi:MAG: stress response protein [Acidimicrobiales bacterium]